MTGVKILLHSSLTSQSGYRQPGHPHPGHPQPDHPQSASSPAVQHKNNEMVNEKTAAASVSSHRPKSSRDCVIYGKYPCIEYDQHLNLRLGLEAFAIDRPGCEHPLVIPSHVACNWSSDLIENLENHRMDVGDVLLYAPPKCGTHWMWEILSMLTRGERTYHIKPKHAFWLEMRPYSSIVETQNIKPRVLNTHQMLSQLPRKFRLSSTKTVVCIRNPKDVLVSSYYHFRNFMPRREQDGDFQSFHDLFHFLSKSKYVPFGSIFDHLADLWDNHRLDPNVLIVFYEDLKENTLEEIRRVADHIGAPYTDNFLQGIADAVDINTMRDGKYPSEENLRRRFGPNVTLYRKGEIGDWKSHFTQQQNAEVEKMIGEWNKNRQVPFRYEASKSTYQTSKCTPHHL